LATGKPAIESTLPRFQEQTFIAILACLIAPGVV
jgi:hypothetical protein